MARAMIALLAAGACALHAPLRALPTAPPRIPTVMLIALSPPPPAAPPPAAPPAAAKSTYFQPLQPGDQLESTPGMRRICAAAAGGIGLMTAKLAFIMCTVPAVSPPLVGLAALAGFEFADFGSGVYHWSMDNYGNRDTPIWGKQIEAFQGHHERPWTICHRPTANNLHMPATAALPFMALYLLFVNGACALAFGTVTLVFAICAQELHKWAHTMAKDSAPLPEAMQRAGLTVTRKAHLWHHKAPYDCNYCIVSGHCNPFLDRVGFFPALERLVYSINGVKPRCWTEDSSWVSWAADGTIAKKG